MLLAPSSDKILIDLFISRSESIFLGVSIRFSTAGSFYKNKLTGSRIKVEGRIIFIMILIPMLYLNQISVPTGYYKIIYFLK